MEDPNTMEDKPKWEIVTEKPGVDITDRLPVEGGWLYRTMVFSSTTTASAGQVSVALAFVRDTRERAGSSWQAP